MVERDVYAGNLIERLERIEAAIRTIERSLPGMAGTAAGHVAYYNEAGVLAASAVGLATIVREDNVSNPPTNAQLDAAFGEPATLGPGFIGFINDNAGGVNVWLVVAVSDDWYYEKLTKAT